MGNIVSDLVMGFIIGAVANVAFSFIGGAVIGQGINMLEQNPQGFKQKYGGYLK